MKEWLNLKIFNSVCIVKKKSEKKWRKVNRASEKCGILLDYTNIHIMIAQEGEERNGKNISRNIGWKLLKFDEKI